ncbi:MAG TPA: secretion system protein E, partial [Methanocorpusculum sp.]|nr:secretion system protein E [Methanocorpusculum sp.]
MFQKKTKRIPVPEYDFVRDGPLVTPEYDPSLTLVEAYWTRPGLALVVIVLTPANEYQYLVFEPSLTPFEKTVLERLFPGVRDLLIRTDVAMDEGSRTKALYDAMDLYLERFSIDLTPDAVQKIRYYLKRNYLGWGILDPLQQDVEI